MPAKGILLLRLAVFCGMAPIAGTVALGQFLESPGLSFFGDDFVKTFDMRDRAAMAANRGKESPKIDRYESLLLFQDGRQLRGRLVSIGRNEIIWKRPDFTEPLHLRRADLRRVEMAPKIADGFDPNQSFSDDALFRILAPGEYRPVPAAMKLNGDDWLRGAVTSPDGQSFALRMDDKGTSISIPRSQIEWMYFDWDPVRGGQFDGNAPNRDDWLASAPSARLANDGALVISQENEWFGRLLSQPSHFEISMEISADSEEGNRLLLLPSSIPPGQVASLEMEFGPKQLVLRNLLNPTDQKSLPLPTALGADPKDPVRYRIFYDSDQRRLVIFRNGLNMADWKAKMPKLEDAGQNPPLPPFHELTRMYAHNIMMGLSIAGVANASQPFPAGFCLGSVPDLLVATSYFHFSALLLMAERRSGFPRITGFRLVLAPQNGDPDEPSLKLRRFRLAPWDGALPPKEETVLEDRLSPAASRSIAGQLESITDKEVIFSRRNEPKRPGMFIRLPHESGVPFESAARIQIGDAAALSMPGFEFRGLVEWLRNQSGAGELSVSALEIRDGKAHLRTAFSDDVELPAAALTSISFSAPAPPAPIQGDSLVFKNGDELPGALISAGADEPLRWKLSTGQEVITELKNLAGVRRDVASASKRVITSPLAELRNGDRLRGAVVSLDENHLVFEEPLLGRLPLDRSQIWKLFPNSTSGIRDGAESPGAWMSDDLSNWLSANRQQNTDLLPTWLYLDGCYISRPIRQSGEWGRMLSLSSTVPHQDSGLFEVRADIATLCANGTIPSGTIRIAAKATLNGTPDININFGEGIDVNVSGPHGIKSREAKFGPEFRKRTTRLSTQVFVNSILGTADIMLDGVLVARMGQDPDERSPGVDYAVEFGGSTFDQHPMVFSNLWIGPWNGELPHPETAGHKSTALSNGDVTANVPSTLKDGTYGLETEAGPLRLPASSVSAIAFGGEYSPAHAAARLRLVDGSVIHVSRFECQDRAISAHSQSVGEIRLPLESIAEIIFNPAPLREPLTPLPKMPAHAAPPSAAPPAIPQETR